MWHSVSVAILFAVRVLLLGCSAGLRTASALSLDLARGTTRCVSQELDPEDAVELLLHASLAPSAPASSNPASSSSITISTELYHPDGHLLRRGGVAVGQRDSVKLAIDRSGAYKMCFQAPPGDGAGPLRVSFSVAIAGSGDQQQQQAQGSGSSTDTKDKMSILESQFRTAEKKLLDITREIEFARRREEINEDAETLHRLQVFGAASVLLLLATSVYQVYYLRSFFVSKKLL